MSASAVSTSVPPLPRQRAAPRVVSASVAPTASTTTSAPFPRVSSRARPARRPGVLDGVRRPDGLRELPPEDDRVDGDHVRGAGVHRALHRVDPDPAAAHDDDGVPGPGAAGVHRRAPAGGHAAGHQRSGVQRHPRVQSDHRCLAEQRVPGERADHAEPAQRLAVQPERPGAGRQLPGGDGGAQVAEVRPARRTPPATPAGRQEAGDDVVPGRDPQARPARRRAPRRTPRAHRRSGTAHRRWSAAGAHRSGTARRRPSPPGPHPDPGRRPPGSRSRTGHLLRAALRPSSPRHVSNRRPRGWS